jgi:hypothetical protein
MALQAAEKRKLASSQGKRLTGDGDEQVLQGLLAVLARQSLRIAFQ